MLSRLAWFNQSRLSKTYGKTWILSASLGQACRQLGRPRHAGHAASGPGSRAKQGHCAELSWLWLLGAHFAQAPDPGLPGKILRSLTQLNICVDIYCSFFQKLPNNMSQVLDAMSLTAPDTMPFHTRSRGRHWLRHTRSLERLHHFRQCLLSLRVEVADLHPQVFLQLPRLRQAALGLSGAARLPPHFQSTCSRANSRL